MRPSLAVPLVLAVGFALFFYSQLANVKSTLREQQGRIHDLEEKATARALTTDLLELQERCAKQAERDFQSMDRAGGKAPAGKYDPGDYTNHYNPVIKKCFILVERYDLTGPSYKTKFIEDAVERKEYGAYTWPSDRKSREKPFECHVTMPSGEKKFCESEDEFDTLVATYMK